MRELYAFGWREWWEARGVKIIPLGKGTTFLASHSSDITLLFPVYEHSPYPLRGFFQQTWISKIRV